MTKKNICSVNNYCWRCTKYVSIQW